MSNRIIIPLEALIISAEIGLDTLHKGINGGLGILVGDWLKSCADMGIPVAGITNYYPFGFFEQEIDKSGWQIGSFRYGDCPPLSQQWNPANLEMQPFISGDHTIASTINGLDVTIGSWLDYVMPSPGTTNGNPVPLIYMNLSGLNGLGRLYDDDLKPVQFRMLAAGLPIAQKLFSVDNPKIHLNDSHGALATIELYNQLRPLHNSVEDTIKAVRALTRFTTHTIVSAASYGMSIGQIESVMGRQVDPELIDYFKIKRDNLDFGWLSMMMSGQHQGVNGVARLHTDVTRNLFSGVLGPEQLHNITNGVHHMTWTSQPFIDLYDQKISGWRNNPMLLWDAPNLIADDEIWDAHQTAKNSLTTYINDTYSKKRPDLVVGGDFSDDALTIGFARRFATYKRGDLQFMGIDHARNIEVLDSLPQEEFLSTIDNLIELGEYVNKYYHKDLQVVIAGKAHPNDDPGKLILQRVIQSGRSLLGHHVKFAFIEDYDMDKAKILTSGVDIWLNTPQRPYEASGTSGMKAALNGVMNFSVPDGWWVEGYLMSNCLAKTLGYGNIAAGWNIGENKEMTPQSFSDEIRRQDHTSFIDVLKNQIVPAYHAENKEPWLQMMKLSSALGGYFNTHRCISEYATRSWGLGTMPMVQLFYEKTLELQRLYLSNN
ncbi:MAG: glycogen/starch/alpha-glucan phosphorylase [archaeon]